MPQRTPLRRAMTSSTFMPLASRETPCVLPVSYTHLVGIDRTHLRKPNQIRVAAAPVRQPRNNEPLTDGIDIHPFASFKGERRRKGGKLLLVFRAVGKLIFDILHR